MQMFIDAIGHQRPCIHLVPPYGSDAATAAFMAYKVIEIGSSKATQLVVGLVALASEAGPGWIRWHHSEPLWLHGNVWSPMKSLLERSCNILPGLRDLDSAASA